MELTPSYETFAKAYEAGRNQLVFTRLAADLDTPVSLMLKLTGAARDAFMLESVTGGEIRGRIRCCLAAVRLALVLLLLGRRCVCSLGLI